MIFLGKEDASNIPVHFQISNIAGRVKPKSTTNIVLINDNSAETIFMMSKVSFNVIYRKLRCCKRN